MWKWKWKFVSCVLTLFFFLVVLTLCDPMDYTVHGILQARILEWVAFSFSKGSSQPRDWTQVSLIVGEFSTSWAIRKPIYGEAAIHRHLLRIYIAYWPSLYMGNAVCLVPIRIMKVSICSSYGWFQSKRKCYPHAISGLCPTPATIDSLVSLVCHDLLFVAGILNLTGSGRWGCGHGWAMWFTNGPQEDSDHVGTLTLMKKSNVWAFTLP